MLTSYLGIPRAFFDSVGVTREGYELVSDPTTINGCILTTDLIPVSEWYLQSGFYGQMDGVLLRSAIRRRDLEGQ